MSQPPQAMIDKALALGPGGCGKSDRRAVLWLGRISYTGRNRPVGSPCLGERCKERDGAEVSVCARICEHAEAAAIRAAGKVHARGAELLHLKVVRGQAVASGAPSCLECAKAALVAGVAGVWLLHDSGWRRYPAQHFFHLSALSQGINLEI